jgi:hypothetical protein
MTSLTLLLPDQMKIALDLPGNGLLVVLCKEVLRVRQGILVAHVCHLHHQRIHHHGMEQLLHFSINHMVWLDNWAWYGHLRATPLQD